jgi:hypothetical protein
VDELSGFITRAMHGAISKPRAASWVPVTYHTQERNMSVTETNELLEMSRVKAEVTAADAITHRSTFPQKNTSVSN